MAWLQYLDEDDRRTGACNAIPSTPPSRVNLKPHYFFYYYYYYYDDDYYDDYYY